MRNKLQQFSKRLLLCAALCSASPVFLRAADEMPEREISEKVSSEFGEIRPLIDGKKYADAVKHIDKLISEVKVDSYDFFVLSQMKAQIVVTMGDMKGAIEPLEKSLQVGEKYNFFEGRALYDQVSMLTQLYYQQATEQKDPALQEAAYEKTYTYVKRAISLAPKPSLDLQMLAASVLYNQGSLSTTPNQEKFRESIIEARRGLYFSAKPPEQLYQLMLSSLQQLGELEQAAEILELTLEQKPKNAQGWGQLVAIYMALAQKAKDEAAIHAQNLRAILTIERAQANGFLSSPRENYTLVALYFTIQQYAKAAELLEKGLGDGSIESQKRNWELLANAYQQLNKESRAIEALTRATTIFPTEGQLEFTLAQLLYGQGNIEAAYDHSMKAASKGQLEKPGQAYLYLAYLGYELKKLEDASRWVDQASAYTDVKPSDIAPIKRAITEAIKERENLPGPSKA